MFSYHYKIMLLRQSSRDGGTTPKTDISFIDIKPEFKSLGASCPNCSVEIGLISELSRLYFFAIISANLYLLIKLSPVINPTYFFFNT